MKDQLERLKERILAQNGTVLETVEGEVALNDVDGDGKPRLGPVLVLRSIEEGAALRLAQPRPVTVLGSLSGQVFGAYRVKAGNLLSGRLEGVRHVEIAHDLGTRGDANAEVRIIFEPTRDPGFFAQAQHGLEKLRQLESHQQPQQEDLARPLLLRTLKDVPYNIKVFASAGRELKTAFTLHPSRYGREVELDLGLLLRHLIIKTEPPGKTQHREPERVEHFQAALKETIAESLRLANSGGIGAALRKQRGQEVYQPQVEALYTYLFPKLMHLWLNFSERFMQSVADRLGEAPMTLRVQGQLSPFFQLEYPMWRFRVTGSKIAPEKIADCHLAGQPGKGKDTMSLTYTCAGAENWITQTREIELSETRNCQLILKTGHVYLNEETHCLFGPTLEGDPARSNQSQ